MKQKVRRNTPDEDAAVLAGIAADDDNPEWTEQDVAAAQPAASALPVAVYAELAAPRRRGPGAKAAKAQVTLRLDRDVVDGLRASGPGWQVRANEALRKLVAG